MCGNPFKKSTYKRLFKGPKLPKFKKPPKLPKEKKFTDTTSLVSQQSRRRAEQASSLGQTPTANAAVLRSGRIAQVSEGLRIG